jgi:hypothetical protein
MGMKIKIKTKHNKKIQNPVHHPKRQISKARLQRAHRNFTIKTAHLERLKSIRVFHQAMNMGR